MLRCLLALCVLCSVLSLSAQKYTTAAGIRLGSGIGITVQQSLWDKYTAEAIIQKGLLNNYTTVSALFEQHNGLFSRGTNFYIGAGPQIGVYKQRDNKDAVTEGVFGVSFIGGLEMKFGHTLLSFDYKPTINITGGSFLESGAAVSLRYIFLKAQPKEHKWMFWKKKKGGKNDD
jgi:hypothetical protein